MLFSLPDDILINIIGKFLNFEEIINVSICNKEMQNKFLNFVPLLCLNCEVQYNPRMILKMKHIKVNTNIQNIIFKFPEIVETLEIEHSDNKDLNHDISIVNNLKCFEFKYFNRTRRQFFDRNELFLTTTINNIIKTNPNLKCLFLSFFNMRVDLTNLKNLTKLFIANELDLSVMNDNRNFNISNQIFINNPFLTHLNLTGVTFNSETLKTMANNCFLLEYLTLTNYDEILSDEMSLISIIRSNANLKYLKIHNFNLSNEFIIKLIENCKDIIDIDFSGLFAGRTDINFNILFETYKKLESIYLSNCNFEAHHLACMMNNCKNIKQLSILSNNYFLNVEPICQLYSNLTTLEFITLDIIGTLVLVSTYLNKLEFLSLDNILIDSRINQCPLDINLQVIQLADSCPDLVYLNIQINIVNAETLRYLKEKCKNLSCVFITSSQILERNIFI